MERGVQSPTFKGELMRGEILEKSILGLWKDTYIKAPR